MCHSGPSGKEHQGEPHCTLVLGDGDTLEVTNTSKDPVHFVLVGGKPLGEPIVQHGNIDLMLYLKVLLAE